MTSPALTSPDTGPPATGRRGATGCHLGAHTSVAGGLPTAFERAAELACTAMQIFVKSPNQWHGRALDDVEAEAFLAARGESELDSVIAHGAYLINLCATDGAVLARSRRGLGDELDRAERLGLAGLVVHPGAHLGEGEEAGIDAIARSLDAILALRPEGSVPVLLENTAGQGTVLGHELEQLAAIRRRVDEPERIGFCLDTCHAFAAGYPLHEADGYEAWIDEMATVLGLERVLAFHLNDSQHPLGSKKDRHANLGEGEIGPGAFERLVTDPRLAGRPMVIETPAGDDRAGHRRDLELLRSFG